MQDVTAGKRALWYSSFIASADPILRSTALGCSFIFSIRLSNYHIVNFTRTTYNAIGPPTTWQNLSRLTYMNNLEKLDLIRKEVHHVEVLDSDLINNNALHSDVTDDKSFDLL